SGSHGLTLPLTPGQGNRSIPFDRAWNECLAAALAWVREGTMSRLAAGAMALALVVTLGGADAALAAGPKAYVGLFKDDAVAVIDTTQNRVAATIPVPKGP